MITSAGDTAAPFPRLRPKQPNSPPLAAPEKHFQGVDSKPAPLPLLHNLLLDSAISVQLPFSDSLLSSDTTTLDRLPDDDGAVTSDRDIVVGDSTFFGSAHLSTSLSGFLDSASSKSFYGVATPDSGSTARGSPPLNIDKPSTNFVTNLHSSMDQYVSSQHSRAPQIVWTSNLSESIPFSTSPEADGFYGAGGNKSPRRAAQKKISSREPNMVSSSQGRDICIAVVGSRDVGKSTFIQKAYDLKALPKHSSMSSKSLLVEKLMCEVKLVEVDIEAMDLESQPLTWPKLLDGQRLSFVDGALILYDVTSSSSVDRVPEFLDAFAKVSLPTLLVASKCDAPLNKRQIDLTALEHLGLFGGVEPMQTTANSASHKKCFARILNIIIARRNEKRHLNGRRRANSTNNSRGTSPRPSTSRSGHSRASSEFSATLLKEYPQSQSQNRVARPPTSSHGGPASLSVGSTPHLTLTASSPMIEVINMGSFLQPSEEQDYNSLLSVSNVRDSFLDADDDFIKDPDDVPILEREGSVLGEDYQQDAVEDDEQKPARTVGYTWDELVDRLLQEKMSKSDANFAIIFLCFYRKITPPGELLRSILGRFETANSNEILLARINTQLRYCMILNQWVAEYPGDFAHPKTRQKFTSFLNSISSNRTFAFLAREMQQNLLNTVEDEDSMWGKADGEKEEDGRRSTFSAVTFQDHQKLGGGDSKADRQTLSVPPIDAHRRPSEVPHLVSITPGGTLIREQYAQFMETPEQDIAIELTRIDWAEFSQIRPRDLVRHVSTSPEQRDKCKSLEHVSRMISHFNHVAYWVSNIILERPKPKHRTRALEKFMEIAWILRHKNNYNALGAVLAGINSTCIHRLTQTREAVNHQTRKKFMRLELLMNSHRSSFSYRLALENTSTERIPFIPLHRRDLVTTDEGNKTFLDNQKINWNKFQLMGDVLMVIVESQRNPYRDLRGNGVVEKMILEAVISTNEDELFDRSVQLEGVKGQAARRQGSRSYARSLWGRTPVPVDIFTAHWY